MNENLDLIVVGFFSGSINKVHHATYWCRKDKKIYRERLRQIRPEEFERQRKKNLDQVKCNKKKISELTPEEAEIRRQKWKEEKRISRKKEKKAKEPERVDNAPRPETAQQENLKTFLTTEKFIRRLRKKQKFLVSKVRNYTRTIEDLKRKNEKYRKRYQRLKLKTDKQIEDLNLTIMKLKARQEILEHTMKTTYQNCTNRKEKRVLKKLALNSANKSMVSRMLGLSCKARIKRKKFRRHDIPEITKFYTRDDVSRNTAGKKEVRTKNKEKVQIRYLLDTLVNTFRKYKAENGRFGFTTFFKHKPFYVLSPGLSSRSTCLCIKHGNFGFLHDAMVKCGLITGSIQNALSQVSCDSNNYECMWSKCDICKDKKVLYHQKDEEELRQEVEWFRWERQDYTYKKKDGQDTKEITTKKMAKVTKKGTLNDLKNEYERDLVLFKKHYFNMKHQQNQYQKAVSELKENEVLVVCDFSENYQAKLAEQCQSMYYGASNLQICLHTGMVFWKNRSQSFCTLSDNTSHQPPAIWAHLIPILDMIKRESPEITVIHFYSDSPSAQYRQKNNFYLLVYYTKLYQLQYTTWSFYESGHGKNVADGIGGSIKRTLDRKVCSGNDVVDARDAYDLLKQSLKVTKIFLIDNAEAENVAKNLPEKIPVLKGTMQLHQVMTSLDRDSNMIQFRDVGCFCGDFRGLCTCFAPKLHSVTSNAPNLPSTSKKATETVSTSKSTKKDTGSTKDNSPSIRPPTSKSKGSATETESTKNKLPTIRTRPPTSNSKGSATDTESTKNNLPTIRPPTSKSMISVPGTESIEDNLPAFRPATPKSKQRATGTESPKDILTGCNTDVFSITWPSTSNRGMGSVTENSPLKSAGIAIESSKVTKNQANEFPRLEFSEKIHNVDDNFDLDTIDASDLIFLAKDAQNPPPIVITEHSQESAVLDTEKLLRGNAITDIFDMNKDAQNPPPVIIIEHVLENAVSDTEKYLSASSSDINKESPNMPPVIIIDHRQETAVSDTEKLLRGSASADMLDKNANISDPLVVVDKKCLNIQVKKENSSQKHNYFVDPKKEVIKIPQDKTDSPKLLATATAKRIPKKRSIIIHEDITIQPPEPSSSKNKKPKMDSSVKYEGRQKCKNNNFDKLKCHTCCSFIFGEKAKCILCKNWFCSECTEGSANSDFICESCLED